jgi:SIR2-like domain
MPTAATITVSQALDLLDGAFAGLALGVAQRQYAFWLGSGISRDRVDDLRGVIRRVLIYLRDNIDAGNANCAYRIALEEALELAHLSPDDRARVDFTVPVPGWPVIDTVLTNLTREYSRLLDIRVGGHNEPDFLLWEVVDVPTTFSAAHTTPDCEHLCLAILLLEGVLPDLPTANWDGLIEAAVDELTDAAGTALRICVTPEDLRQPPLLTRLLKFHGCAIRAAADPATFRPLLIARYSQITDWPHNHDYELMRRQLVDLAATKPTLMVGLSAQDVNIQFLFGEARAVMAWEWPCDPPAHVFAEDALGQDQRNILRVVYRDDYDANIAAIETSALFRAYAKPALTALVLHVLGAKLRTFVQNVNAPHLAEAERSAVGQGIVTLRNRVAVAAEPDRLAFIRALITAVKLAMGLFQDGTPAADQRYRALGDVPVHRISADANLNTSGIRELAAALGVIGLGDSAGNWTAREPDPADPRTGALRLVAGANTVRIFFAANDRAGVQLEINGLVAPRDTDAIVIHSTSPVPKMARSPLAAPGRTGHSGLRNVGMAELLHEATSSDNLCERFREEAIL